MVTALLYLLPALVLALVLLARRYPGERLLIARAARRRPRWLRARSSVRATGLVRVLFPRGGALLGRALAERPPPLGAAS